MFHLGINLLQQFSGLVVGPVALRLDGSGTRPIKTDGVQNVHCIRRGAESLTLPCGRFCAALVDGHVVLFPEDAGRG